MAKKISQLGLAGDVATNDLLTVLDVSDQFMAPTGTNKRITAQTLGNFLPVTATGSSASRSLKDRFADTVNVKDFGAVGDGVTDDTAAIQNAIDYCATKNGGYVIIPSGSYKISSSISITTNNIKIEGHGGNVFHDGGSGAETATRIIWGGPISTVSVFTFYTPQNISNSKRFGSGLKNVTIECNSLISGGLSLLSVAGGTFENIFISNPTFTGVIISNYIAGQLAEATDSQLNLFSNVSVRCIDDLSKPDVNGFILTSNDPFVSYANTSFNRFEYCQVQCRNGTGFILSDADNNNFMQCRVFVVGTTGKGLDCQGADSNYFYGFSCSGFPSKLWIRGTASGFLANPVNNCFIFPDQGNGTTYPNIDSNCKIGWIGQSGVTTKDRSAKHVISDSEVNSNTLIDSIGSESLIIDNNSINNVLFTKNASKTNAWGISVGSGTGQNDLRISSTVLTNELNIGNGVNVLSGIISPLSDNSYTLGKSTLRWSAIWSANGVIQTSDERSKTEIETSKLGLDFINNLNPVSYKFSVGSNKVIGNIYRDINGAEVPKDTEGAIQSEIITEKVEGQRTHYGLLAQQVKSVLPEGADFGGWILTDKDDPESQQGLRYEEFISPMIKAIQELSAKVDLLESK